MLFFYGILRIKTYSKNFTINLCGAFVNMLAFSYFNAHINDMKQFDCSIGRKRYSLRCQESAAEKFVKLGLELNQIVNRNAIQYKGLSDDNLFLITAMQLLDETKTLKHEIDNTEQKIGDIAFEEVLGKKDDEIRALKKEMRNAISAKDYEIEELKKKHDDLMRGMESVIQNVKKTVSSFSEKK